MLIVGAGHAGAHAAIKLRELNYAGSIGLLSDEAAHPYERPPLTKGFFNGKVTLGDLLIRPEPYWAENGIEVLLEHRVTALDPAAHVVTTSRGTHITYGHLVWAAGAAPIKVPIPGADLPGVHFLRSLADAQRFGPELRPGARIVVIGGGYIGLEVASSCVTAGASAAVLESRSRLLSRVTGTELSERLLRLHRDRGVQVELDAQVVEVLERDGRASGVLLADGRTIDADSVLMAVGVAPNTAVLAAAGAECSNGVDIDAHCRTSLADVYAVGDCANFPYQGVRTRLESVQNAAAQGAHVAALLAGDTSAYSLEPYFWSDQFDARIKTVGLVRDYDDQVVRCGRDEGSFSVVYLKDGRVQAVDTVNAMKDYVDARKLLGHKVSPELIRDSSIRLREALLGREYTDAL
ncbi:NAD(P)/FAD-dependent oxidoreductase [Georgenia sp. AZ-5]|uniref:NAD(P)/FAD-dependent oxidoreductase n=1 Tax=Georgenia sp. AZ-5 TaxID=3367526 RepID=UPI003754CBEB